MNSCCLVIVILSTLAKSTTQICTDHDVFPGSYAYTSRRKAITRRYIHCEAEILSSDFHTKISPFFGDDSSIGWVEVNNTDSPDLSANAFGNLLIPEIRIDGAGIYRIQSRAFSGTKSLKILSLKNNQISEVREGSFSDLSYLVELDLSFNRIASIEEQSLIDLKSLRTLTLSNNHLTDLPLKVFENLESIIFLDLSFNKLKTFNTKLIENMERLVDLALNNNQLSSLDGSVLWKNFRLTNLFLNNNNISSINNISLANPLHILNVSHNFIDTLTFFNSTHISVVDLTKCALTSLPNSFFKNLITSTIYFDQNYLGLETSLHEIFGHSNSLIEVRLNENQIKEFDGSFLRNNKLEKLKLAKNDLFGESVLNLPLSLQKLDVSFNNISSGLILTYLVNLQTLDVSFNYVTEISYNFLKDLTGLIEIYLHNNQISKICLGAFRDLSNLKALYLANNHITTLEIGVFVGLKDLRVLDIAHNNLTVVNEDVFNSIKNVHMLFLEYTNFTFEMVENLLTHLHLLLLISLGGNNWSCQQLSSILKLHKSLKLKNEGNYDVTNVEGVACTYEMTDSAKLLDLETKSFLGVNSKLFTNNVVLILILLLLIFKAVLRHITFPFSLFDKVKRLVNRNRNLERSPSIQELLDMSESNV